MAVTYLYRYRESRGVHDYLCNELYKLNDADLEAFMPQVCNLLVFHARDSPGLERFVMDKCADSMHIALQVFYFLQAAVEDKARLPDRVAEARVRLLRTRCETAAVNGSKHAMLEAAATRVSAAALVATETPFSARKREVDGNSLFPSSSACELSVKDSGQGPKRSPERKSTSVLQAEQAYDFDTLRSDADPGGLIEAVTETMGTLVRMVSGVDEVDDEITKHAGKENGVENKVDDAKETQSPQPATDDSEMNSNDEGTPSKAKGAANPDLDYDPVTLLTMKQERFDYFNDSVTIAKAFIRLSLSTRELAQEQRQSHLQEGLEKINEILLRRMVGEPGVPLVEDAPIPDVQEVAKLGAQAALRSLHLPLTRANSYALRILRVHSDEVTILTSRTRAPYMVNIEVLPTNMKCADKLLFCEQRVVNPAEEEHNAETSAKKPPKPSAPGGKSIAPSHLTPSKSVAGPEKADQSSLKVTSSKPTHVRRLSQMTPEERQRANVRKVVYGDPHSDQPDRFALAELNSEHSEDRDSAEYKSQQAVILGVYGELWAWKEERILSRSPFRNIEGTKLMPFIVKGGDDLRQEQLAVQLITQFHNIFKQENVDVFLRPYTVMSVSSEAGFVEVITDAVSVHTLKKRTPNFVSLLDYFERAFGENGTPSFRAAQRRFIRSMAGYSLVTYFLQIKDRHNGNIMIDADGHIIHIDFGFMLTNSPGAIKFENVPFKLTEEYLQVICAKKNVLDLAEASKTEGYRYFQEMFVLGMLAARKHYEKITTLVEIMTQGTTMPCMTGGHSIVECLRSRFAVGMPEEQCVSLAMSLIEESRLSWRSAGYDRFQAYSNGYR